MEGRVSGLLCPLIQKNDIELNRNARNPSSATKAEYTLYLLPNSVGAQWLVIVADSGSY